MKKSQIRNNITALTKISDSVGAFVEVPVQGVTHQLQRVISRCGCEFRYVSLDDELDAVAEEYVPSTPQVILVNDPTLNCVIMCYCASDV